jgi:L,D-transpeptidase catalytic domain/Putative peptidoglycan binding domain
VGRLLVLIPIAAIAVAAAAPSATRPLPPIASGVKIGGISVGGLNAEAARAHVERVWDRPVLFEFGKKSWRASPHALGGAPRIERAVRFALRARYGSKIRLRVHVDHDRLAAYIARLDNRLSEPAENAELVGLSNLRPVIAEGRPGLRVNRAVMAARISHVLRATHRTPIQLAVEHVAPTVTAENFGPIIVIETGSNRLLLYDGTTLEQTFVVATGQSAYPTPTGEWSIVQMQRNPWWIPPPNATWAQGAKPIPPGPGNPLGTRWMGLSAPGVGIHGTPDAASLGYSQSHGCIRMAIPDAEWLFDHVHVGTPVFTVAA